ncbi:MAG: ABC transporter substrate-binding protein [Propionicimonas sp.]
MRKLLAVLVGTLLLAGCAAPAAAPTPSVTATPSATPSLTAVRIGLSYIPNVQFAPFYVAEADGLFAANGVAATLRHHGASEGLFTAIAAGQEDFVIAGGDEALQAREQGIDLVAIATYYRSYPVQIIAKESGPIDSLAGLKGKRIGVPGRYGESWFGLLVALSSAGLTEKDVDIVEVGYTQQAALTTGKVDAVVGFSNNDLVQFGLAKVAVRALPLTKEGEPPLVSISLLTTRDFLTAHPAVAQGVAKAMVSGISSTAADPERALTISADQVPGLGVEPALSAARATLTATLTVMLTPEGKADGSLDLAQWQAMADFMLAKGLLTKTADVTAATAPEVLAS